MASRCGNGVLDPGEACDTDADAACPGLCQPDCRCSQSSCTLDNPRATITTLGKGQSRGNNAKVSHRIAGHLVGGADAYGPRASRIRICEGTEVSAIISDTSGVPEVTGVCEFAFCTIPELNAVEKYQARSADRKDRDRISLVPVR